MKKTRTQPTFDERVRWNSNTYGKAITIKRKQVIGFIIFLCMITPATNWIIPFLGRLIKTGITIRYGV